MLRFKNHIFPGSLEEAYELNQKRSNKIVGGNGWLRLGSKQCVSIIDLSNLGLDGIEEKDDEFIIGAMTTLRELELNKGFNEYTGGAAKEAVRHIVGVQFRNCVTLGGSIYGRFGFSDVLTLFLALDSYVEMYKGGVIPISEFAKMKYDNDILVNIRVKKADIKTVYTSFRNQSTDFPVLTCAISLGSNIKTAIGARPARADVVEGEIPKDMEKYAIETAKSFTYGSNIRGSAEYREQIAYVLIKRSLSKLI